MFPISAFLLFCIEMCINDNKIGLFVNKVTELGPSCLQFSLGALNVKNYINCSEAY